MDSSSAILNSGYKICVIWVIHHGKCVSSLQVTSLMWRNFMMLFWSVEWFHWMFWSTLLLRWLQHQRSDPWIPERFSYSSITIMTGSQMIHFWLEQYMLEWYNVFMATLFHWRIWCNRGTLFNTSCSQQTQSTKLRHQVQELTGDTFWPYITKIYTGVVYFHWNWQYNGEIWNMGAISAAAICPGIKSSSGSTSGAQVVAWFLHLHPACPFCWIGNTSFNLCSLAWVFLMSPDTSVNSVGLIIDYLPWY